MWKFSIDTGGTFTDCVAEDPEGRLLTLKVLSSGILPGRVVSGWGSAELIIDAKWHLDNPVLNGFRISFHGDKGQEYARVLQYFPGSRQLLLDRKIADPGIDYFSLDSGEEAPVLCIRLLTGTPLGSTFPALDFRIGTTRGTNALLERKGARFVMLVTRGFEDLMVIDDQTRPDIFARKVEKPRPLYSEILEVPERIDSSGRVLESPDSEALDELVSRTVATGLKSAGVCLLNAWKNSEHEVRLGAMLREGGFSTVTISSELDARIKYLERARTTAVNSYLQPVMDSFLERISTQAGNRSFRVMTSSGGLKPDSGFQARDSLLSGPAGGVVGVAETAKASGLHKVISFDMGGTSTDVSRYDNGYDYSFELQIAGLRIATPAVAIETVAAGGGSICSFDGFKLSVGPESAGADPGPACYGRGGPLTVTDINLLAGRVDPSLVSIPIYPQASLAAAREMTEEIARSKGLRFSIDQLIEGLLKIADEIMAGAIKKISTGKGFSPAEYAMVAFGGAGGMHACGVAGILGISTIISPPRAGLLSAEGIRNAQPEYMGHIEVLKNLDTVGERLQEMFAALEAESRRCLAGEGVAAEDMECAWKRVYIRFLGQESSLCVDFRGEKALAEDFRREYEKVFGHWNEKGIPEIESIRVLVRGRVSAGRGPAAVPGKSRHPSPDYLIEPLDGCSSKRVPVHSRDALGPGVVLEGPCLVPGRNSTLYVDRGWSARVDERFNIILRRQTSGKKLKSNHDEDAVGLELFSRRFMNIAENMGAMLQRCAYSVNVKERLDFSCALIDPSGYLVANAPHIPVHLGSLGICVRKVREEIDFFPGDVVVTNHPAFGGSHLPDITVISPVYDSRETLLGFVVNRAHHAEIGGITPGSMPPDAANLAEEGVLLFPFKLISGGKADWGMLERLLVEDPYPSRSPEVNLTDINAAIAANRQGARDLSLLAEQEGSEKVLSYMTGLRAYTRKRMERQLGKITPAEYAAEEFLDDGWPIRVRLKKTGDRVVFDFRDSGPVHPQNLNGTRAIVESVVMYVLRLMLDEDLPLNDGLMGPVEILLSEGILSPDFSRAAVDCPAVNGGNVELSQRLTDTLIKALRLMACSQGTMNNLVFGNQEVSYYETICGGCGAGEGFDGADAVHHHMTNTRITDPEILEFRFPVRLRRFQVRKGSGGPGRFRGGSGVVRELEFLDPVTLSLLSQHRVEKPFGMSGGGPGKPGRQYRIQQDGTINELPGSGTFSFTAGERIVIETPGGGGWGSSD